MTIENDLRQSMNEESLAADSYYKRAENARMNGDEISAALWDHIAEEEIGHYNEFKDRLNTLPRAEERRAREYRERTGRGEIPIREAKTIRYCPKCDKLVGFSGIKYIEHRSWCPNYGFLPTEGEVWELKEHYPEEYEAMRPERSGVIVTVTHRGESSWSIGDTIASEDFDLENERLGALGKTPALGEYHY